MPNIQDLLPKLRERFPPITEEEYERGKKAIAARNSVCKPDCELCGGAGYIKRNPDASVGDPDFGQMDPCPNLDLTRLVKPEAIGLTAAEMRLDWLHLVNRGDTKKAEDILHTCLKQGYGFVYLWSHDSAPGNPGGNGLAKSLMLKIVVLDALRRGKSAVYVDMSSLLDHLRAAYRKENPSSDSLSRLDFWLKIPVLCLDEFNRVNETDYAVDKRFTLLNNRYAQATRQESLTIIASNTPPDQQEDAIRDRLKDGRVFRVRLTGESARPGMDASFTY